MNFTDGITYVIRRRHNLTFGYLYRRLQQNSLTYPNARGSFSFSGLLTSEINANGQPLAEHRIRFRRLPARPAAIEFPAPAATSIIISGAGPPARTRRTTGASIAGLSINVGIRYEYFSPYTELYGHLANLDVNSTFTKRSRRHSGR